MRPARRTTMSSASRTVARRWAMTRQVRPANRTLSARWMACSVKLSILAVASSRIRMLGVGDQGAGEGDQLALADREVAAALAELGVVAVRQADDEVVRRHRLGRGDRRPRGWRRRCCSGCSRRSCRRTGTAPAAPCRRTGRADSRVTSRTSIPPTRTERRRRRRRSGGPARRWRSCPSRSGRPGPRPCAALSSATHRAGPAGPGHSRR